MKEPWDERKQGGSRSRWIGWALSELAFNLLVLPALVVLLFLLGAPCTIIGLAAVFAALIAVVWLRRE